MVNHLISKLTEVPEALRKSIARTRVTYRQLGNAGLRVSNPILGGAHIGSSKWFPWVLEEDKALPLLKAAYDYGINTWDTANVYSNGESEKIMGKAIKAYKIPRHKITIMTKCFRVMCDEEHYDAGSGVLMQHGAADLSKDYVNQWGLSRSAIFSAVEASLRRLDTDYIDVLQIHRFDPTVPPEETMAALHDIVRCGMVRYLGASSMWTYQFATLQHVAEKNNWTKFVSMQNQYSLLYREEEREMIKYCNATGVGVIPWGPLSHGRLARNPEKKPDSIRATMTPHGGMYSGNDGASEAIVSRVHDIAVRRNWPMSHVALAWLNQKVTAPIIGFSSVDRMNEALEAKDKELTEGEMKYLEELYVSRSIQGHE